MENSVWAKAKIVFLFCGLIFVFAQIFSVDSKAQTRRKTPSRTAKKKTPLRRAAQTNLPKVTQIDTVGLKNLLKREGENAKPLLINFWATWCDPCREEFPELVKINADYKGKIDFITISMDYLSEIRRDVPKFLAEMKAEMPAYLLKTADESEAVTLVSKDWQGALPFTILYDASGNQIYIRQGKIKLETARAEIDKLLAPAEENKGAAKISSGVTGIETSGTQSFNRKPLEDFGDRLDDAILKNEVNINAPFAVEVIGALDENGRLIKPVASVKAGSDEKMSEFAKEFISALSDSRLLKPLNDFRASQISIALAQDEESFRIIIRSETESENRASSAASMIRFALKVSKPKEGSDEAFLLSKTQISSEGKSFIINFSMSQSEKNEWLERELKKRREKPKNN